MGEKLVFILLLCLSAYHAAVAEDRCEKTGPTCKNVEDCADNAVAPGAYQYCGNCIQQLQCYSNKTGALFNAYNPTYPVWDDNKKQWMTESSTCYDQCYFDCPPGPSAPAEPTCNKTGPTCVKDLSICNGLPSAAKFQYCTTCSSYIDCPAPFAGTPSIINCPTNQFYDHTLGGCTAQSSTCYTCYALCDAPVTTQPPLNTTSGNTASLREISLPAVMLTSAISAVLLRLF